MPMTMTKTKTMTRAEVERFDGTGDFSIWTIRMMAHFGVSGLKEVILSDDFEIKVPATKEESKKSDDDDDEDKVETQTKEDLGSNQTGEG